MSELTPSQRQKQSIDVMFNTIGRLASASRRTGWSIGQLVDYAREGHRTLTEPRIGHDYEPFNPGHAPETAYVTVELPDMRLWDKAKENLHL